MAESAQLPQKKRGQDSLIDHATTASADESGALYRDRNWAKASESIFHKGTDSEAFERILTDEL